MADHCIATIMEDEEFQEKCGGACKRGKANCKYWLVDPIWHIMAEWKNEAHINSIMYKIDYGDQKLFIGTTTPGRLIGRHGEAINRYKEKLNRILCFKDHFIEFVEFTEIV